MASVRPRRRAPTRRAGRLLAEARLLAAPRHTRKPELWVGPCSDARLQELALLLVSRGNRHVRVHRVLRVGTAGLCLPVTVRRVFAGFRKECLHRRRSDQRILRGPTHHRPRLVSRGPAAHQPVLEAQRNAETMPPRDVATKHAVSVHANLEHLRGSTRHDGVCASSPSPSGRTAHSEDRPVVPFGSSTS